MRASIITTLFFMGMMLQTVVPSAVCAQPPHNSKPRIEQFRKDRIKFIEKKVQLTELQKNSLNTLLIKYDKERFQLFKQTFDICESIEKQKNVPEAAYGEALERLEILQTKNNELDVKLMNDLRKTFPPKEAFYIYLELKRFYPKAAKRVFDK